MDQSAPLLAGLARRLDYLAARTGVIAENIANADTPDYAARDIKPASFAGRVAAAMRVSHARHMSAGAATQRPQAEPAPDPDVALNGNRVSIETQMMKLSQTRADYQLASSVYRKAVEMIRFAARGGR